MQINGWGCVVRSPPGPEGNVETVMHSKVGWEETKHKKYTIAVHVSVRKRVGLTNRSCRAKPDPGFLTPDFLAARIRVSVGIVTSPAENASKLAAESGNWDCLNGALSPGCLVLNAAKIMITRPPRFIPTSLSVRHAWVDTSLGRPYGRCGWGHS